MSCVNIIPITEGPIEEVLHEFQLFDISQAKCYDPNEQRRVFAVINVIGPDRFNRMVQDIGKRYAQAYGRKKTSLARSKSLLGHFFNSVFHSVAGRFQTLGRGTM